MSAAAASELPRNPGIIECLTAPIRYGWNTVLEVTTPCTQAVTWIFFRVIGFFAPNIAIRMEAAWGYVGIFYEKIKAHFIQKKMQEDISNLTVRVDGLSRENAALKRVNGVATAERDIERELNARAREELVTAREREREMQMRMREQQETLQREQVARAEAEERANLMQQRVGTLATQPVNQPEYQTLHSVSFHFQKQGFSSGAALDALTSQLEKNESRLEEQLRQALLKENADLEIRLIQQQLTNITEHRQSLIEASQTVQHLAVPDASLPSTCRQEVFHGNPLWTV